MPLQMVFTQQTAAALATNRERQLANMIRQSWLWSFLLWFVGARAVWMFQGRIVQAWGLSTPLTLFLALVAMLFALWQPLFMGVLQGRQNFFWLGWVYILGGVLRVGVAALIVLALHGGAMGMMIGVVAGLSITIVIPIWHNRDLLRLAAERFAVRQLLRQVVPLMLGFGALQFLFMADTMFVKSYFTGEQTAFYVAAGTLARALMWAVAPLAAVMFPKIVHSVARSEKVDLLGVSLLITGFLGACSVAGLVLLGPWVIKLVWTSSYVTETTAILPWYACAMVPLALVNILVNDLLARSMFRAVPVLVFLAIAYGLALTHFHKTLPMVLQTLGIFNLLALILCGWLRWGTRVRDKKLPTVVPV